MLIDPVRYPFAVYAINGAPEDAGVYMLWEGQELTYIGKTAGGNSIRSCLLDHFYLRVRCGCRPTHYSWQLDGDTQQREREMLLEHLNTFETLPRCNRNRPAA